MISERYPYFYETHLHTSVGSKCGKATPQEMVDALRSHGYCGTFVTEHNWGGNCVIDRTAYDWKAYIDAYSQGYRQAKAYGDTVGFSVFWGYEAGFGKNLGCRGTEMLIYGISPDFLAAHPEMETMSLPEHCAFVREHGAMVVHAHPFRVREWIPEVRLFPESVCAVEAFNAAHDYDPEDKHYNPQWDESALQYAREHDFPITAGSDIHSVNLRFGGMAFPTPLESVEDYCRRVLERRDFVLVNGHQVFDNRGNLLPDEPSWNK